MKLIFKKNKLLVLILTIISLTIFFVWQNNSIVITNYEYVNPKLPQSFDGYVIVQVSDLHNKDFHGRLLGKIEKANPDLVVFTGDLVDGRKTRIDIATAFLQQIVKLAPAYYVSGNHEQSLGEEFNILKEEMEKVNIQILDNIYVTLNKNEGKIGLMGLADPLIEQWEGRYLWYESSNYVTKTLSELFENIDTNFNILLSHRPELFSAYKDIDVDLVFSGHAHGGQIRIPFIGGLVAPNQGLFPKYTNGIHNEGTTAMVVSRGLGNSIFPLRVFNRPELVIVTLYRTNDQ